MSAAAILRDTKLVNMSKEIGDKLFLNKAKKLGIPDDQAIKILAFARKKSKEKGKSLDELIDLIVNVSR